MKTNIKNALRKIAGWDDLKYGPGDSDLVPMESMDTIEDEVNNFMHNFKTRPTKDDVPYPGKNGEITLRNAPFDLRQAGLGNPRKPIQGKPSRGGNGESRYPEGAVEHFDAVGKANLKLVDNYIAQNPYFAELVKQYGRQPNRWGEGSDEFRYLISDPHLWGNMDNPEQPQHKRR